MKYQRFLAGGGGGGVVLTFPLPAIFCLTNYQDLLVGGGVHFNPTPRYIKFD